MVELQFDTKLKSVQTDCGSEFRPLLPHFQESGILALFLVLIHMRKMAPLNENTDR